ncbi:hypothetical protein Btru_064876 [Bulinus truncatus]|nr:hypothetical protein Btru_064876 [Bulinus truncatus]
MDLKSRSRSLAFLFLLTNVGQANVEVKPFTFQPYVKGPNESGCHHGLMTEIDRLILKAEVDMTQLPSEIYGVHVPYYYLMYENSCTQESNVACRFNLNNPKLNCHQFVAGYECFCSEFKDNTVKLIANLTAILEFDKADFFFTYGPLYNPELSDRFTLPEQVLGEYNVRQLGIIPFNNGSKSRSRLQCSVSCLSNSSYCRHSLYDDVVQLCLLGKDLGSAGIKPPAGQHMYSLWTKYCDVSLGYNSTIMKTYGLCLYISNYSVTFAVATTECTNRQGLIVMIKTVSKKQTVLDILKILNRSSGWIGQDDIQTEGVWVWSDGTLVTTSEITILYTSGYPNNWNNEDCAILVAQSNSANDITCSYTTSYKCEYQP